MGSKPWLSSTYFESNIVHTLLSVFPFVLPSQYLNRNAFMTHVTHTYR